MHVMRYACIMRTTVSIADELLGAAKRRARERGVTLGEVIDQALRRELSIAPAPDERPDVPVFHGRGGPRPGIELSSNRALAEAMDDGAPLDELR